MSNNKICVIGLGNVGLDLALALSEKYATLGYDKSKNVVLNAKKSCKTKKIDNLKKGLFITQNLRKISLESSLEEWANALYLNTNIKRKTSYKYFLETKFNSINDYAKKLYEIYLNQPI